MNDVDIYVEDKRSPTMWYSIIRKLLPRSIKFKSVIMLGGRDVVLAACADDQQGSTRRRLYIIDADFDHLLAKKRPRLQHLYRLRAYCVENLLFSEQAVLSVGMYFDTYKAPDALAVEFNYDEWLDTTVKALRPLFTVYAAAKALCPDIKTVGTSVQGLMINTSLGPVVDGVKAYLLMLKVSRILVQRCGIELYVKAMKTIRNRADKLPYLQVISGKDYLFPLLYHRMQKVFGCKGSHEQVKSMLAQHFDPDIDKGLVKALAAA